MKCILNFLKCVFMSCRCCSHFILGQCSVGCLLHSWSWLHRYVLDLYFWWSLTFSVMLIYFIFLCSAMMLHASFRKLTPAKQLSKGRGRWGSCHWALLDSFVFFLLSIFVYKCFEILKLPILASWELGGHSPVVL